MHVTVKTGGCQPRVIASTLIDIGLISLPFNLLQACWRLCLLEGNLQNYLSAVGRDAPTVGEKDPQSDQARVLREHVDLVSVGEVG